MTRFRMALVILGITAARADAGGVEYHHVKFHWLRTTHEGVLHFSASNPIPMFDDWNGSRRLGRIRMLYSIDFETEVALFNVLPERQGLRYNTYYIAASVWTSTVSVPNPIVDFEGQFAGRLCANPGERVSVTHSGAGGGGPEWTLRNDAYGFLASIGTSLITFSGEGGTAFDTFRVSDTRHDCSGGIISGAPWEYQNSYARFRCDATFEYYWIDADCPVDLTTLADWQTAHYGVPDGIIDVQDLRYFLDYFTAGDLGVADVTTRAVPGSAGYGVPDGDINNDDFLYFLTLFAKGC